MSEIDNKLNEILEIVDEPKQNTQVEIIQYDETEEMVVPVSDSSSSTPPVVINRDMEYDYETSRNTHKELIEKGQEALVELLKVAKESQHPRAYEVASGMLKNLSDMTDKLMNLHRQKKDIEGVHKDAPSQSPIQVDKAVFVGSTADLLKKIKK
jgi:predicted house-cleaning noncanonical NTP pyrophosphatase (MazG superfamily)